MKYLWAAFALFCILGCSQKSSPKTAERNSENQGPQKGDLTRAAASGDLTMVEDLLSKGADINENLSADGNAVTPLLAAIATQHTDVAEYLIRNHAALYPTFEGYGARDFAIELEQNDLVDLLGEEGN